MNTRWIRWARENPSAVLFAVQLLGIVIYPTMENRGTGRALLNAFGLLVVFLALRVVQHSPGLTWVGLLVALPAAVLLLIQVFDNSTALIAWSSSLEAALYLYAAICMVMYMLADTRVTRDELWAVGATFTLLAWAYAHMYVVCQHLAPHSFTAAVNPDGERTWVELLFLSITNLSSTGLSDVAPVKPAARSIVMLEQITGVGFVVMLISLVIAMRVNARRGDGD